MKKITAHQTTDGKIFENLPDAESHQMMIVLRDEYEDSPIYGNYAGSKAEFNDVIEWIKSHKIEVLTLLGGN